MFANISVKVDDQENNANFREMASFMTQILGQNVSLFQAVDFIV
jgi:hypothetical protein